MGRPFRETYLEASNLSLMFPFYSSDTRTRYCMQFLSIHFWTMLFVPFTMIYSITNASITLFDYFYVLGTVSSILMIHNSNNCVKIVTIRTFKPVEFCVVYKQELQLDEFVTHEVEFKDINKAFDLLRNGECLRCVIWMDK